MNNRRSFNNYVLFFIVIVILIVIIFKNLEDKQKNIFLKNSSVKIDNIYQKNIRNIKEYNEIFFHVIKDKNLIDPFFNPNLGDDQLKDITNKLSSSLDFFKTYNIKQIKIYSKNFDLLYDNQGDPNRFILDDIHKKIFKNISKNKKNITTITISKRGTSLNFFKGIIDDRYNFQGIFETSINLPKFAHKILIDEDMGVNFIFKKDILKNYLDKNLLNTYAPYKFNENYLYKKSFYNMKDIGIKLNRKEILSKINSGKSFKFVVKHKNRSYLKYFVPISKYSTKKNMAYIIFTKEVPLYQQISYKYNLLIFFFILSLLFVFIILNQHNRRKKEFFKLETKLKSIIKSIDKYVIFVETNLDGIITYCSQAFCQISGYKKSEIIGRPISIVRSPDISKKFFEQMWKIISKGKTWEGETKNLDKNGNSYWDKGIISPIYDYNKKLIGHRAIKVNITDEKQLQKLNSLLKKELFFKLNEIKTMDQLKVDESKIKLMSQILDTFSNEWKKPISNISSNLLEFEDRVNTARYTKTNLKEFILKQKDEIRYLSINLNEFRKLFVETENNDKYNVSEVIKSVFDSFCNENINFTFKGDNTIKIFGVYYDLKKVISGIIINSIDAFKSKNIENRNINVQLKEKEDTVIIQISDNAGGIPKKILPKIFDYNFSTKYDIKVDGVPLYLAKLIIEKSDGKIWVENIDDGCCFFIELKIKDKRSKKREFI